MSEVAGIFDQPPRLGPLDVRPIENDGRRLFLVFDPTGLHTNAVAVSAEALPLLGFIDGQRDPEGIQAAYAVRTGGSVSQEEMGSFLDTLGEAGLLEGPRLREMRTEGNEKYRQAGKRPPALAGEAYPSDPAELKAAFSDWFQPPPSAALSGIRALVFPHIDFRRAPACYGAALAALSASPADLYVMLGTGHNLARSAVSLSSRSYDTPLGTIESDAEATERVCGPMGEEVFLEEYAHGREHSLEFACVILRAALGPEVPARAVFLLVGSMFRGDQFDEETFEGMERLADVLAGVVAEREKNGERVMLLAAADLSHVGARFGDRGIAPEEDLGWLEEKDREDIGFFAQPDAGAFLELYKRDGNQRNVCGVSAMYALRRVLGDAEVRLAAYEQSREPETLSVVTMATLDLK